MSIRSVVISFILKRTLKPQLRDIKDVPALREQVKRSSRLGGTLPGHVTVTSETINDVPCEWVSMEGGSDENVLLYLHGGGYIFGDPEVYHTLAYRLGEAANARVLIVDYALAPEKPFPAAVDDATHCYRWLIEQGFDPRGLSIGGDSAGGGLAAATLINIKNRGLPQPACAILLSPWVDLALTGESIEINDDADVILTSTGLEMMASYYLGDRDRKAPLASPLYGDLTGLPPTLIQAGSTEVLLSDAERFAEKLRAAGVQVELDIWRKMPHVFQLFTGRVPESTRAVRQLGEFLALHLQPKVAVDP